MKNSMRRFLSVAAVSGLLAGAVLAPAAVFADATLTFNFTSGGDVKLSAFKDGGALETGVSGDGLVSVRGEHASHIGIAKGSDGSELSSGVTVLCASDTACTVTISGQESVRFITPGDAGIELWVDGNPYNFSSDMLSASKDILVQERNDDGPQFDGDAYVIWACGARDNEVCLHLIQEIENNDGETKYYAAETIADIKNPARKFDKFGDYDDEDFVRGMALKGAVEEWVEENYGAGKTVNDVDWSKVNIHDFLRGKNPEEGGGVKLQPLGETQGANSYTSFGDRNFKLTIYGNEYKALELGDLSELTYVPRYWNDANFVDSIDISGTTVESPAIINSVLLEDTVSIAAGAMGGLNIAKIEAVDVPKGAVEVTKNGGSYNLKFNSNYYDNVVFKITDTAGKSYYLQVRRSILDPYMRNDSVWADFYFDDTTSYSDYEITATYVYSDGTFVSKKMVNAKRIDDGLGNIVFENEAVGGTRLKIATYKIEEGEGFDQGLETIFFNVRKAGSTSTNYKGTLAGSGLGVEYQMPHFE